MIRHLISWVFSAGVALTSANCQAPLNLPDGAQDSRLKQRVSLGYHRIQIGDLLTKLKITSGVDLGVREKDGSADVEVAVWVRDLTLSELLDGLQSLLSYKGAKWQWRLEGTHESPRYFLVRTQPAAAFPKTLRREVERHFLSHVDVMISAARMDRNARAEVIRTVSDSMLQADDSVAVGLANTERIWTGLRLFGDVVPEAKREGVLLNGKTLTVSLSEIPRESREFVMGLYEKESKNALRKAADGTLVPVPPPTKVFIHASRTGFAVTPSLFIELEHGGGYAYAGGLPLDRGFRDLLRKMWILDGDREDDNTAIRSIPPLTPVLRSEAANPLAGRLAEAARGCPVNIIARLPLNLMSDPGTGSRGALADFLKRLDENRILMSKWRNHLLLLDSPSWFWDVDALAPWAVMKKLRDLAARNHGALPLADAIDAVAQLTLEQAVHSAEEFPELQHLVRIRPVFMFGPIGRRKILSPEGMKADKALLQALGILPAFADGLARHSPRAIRVFERTATDAAPAEVVLEFQTAEGKWMPVWGYTPAVRYPPVEE